MRTNTAYSEEFYTYREIRLIEKRAKESIKRKLIQKAAGLFLLLLTAAEFIAAHKELIDEGGLFIIALPLGLYLLLTKKNAFAL